MPRSSPASHRILSLLAVALVLLTFAGTASARSRNNSGETGYFVTFAARWCPQFTDIYANLARNDLQESLKDLGPNSQYLNNGRLVNPTDEQLAPQNACHPLTDWKFTLGTGIAGQAVTGPWGSLSKVTNPFPRGAIVTKSSTPLLDQNGQTVAHTSLAGAVTIELTKAERTQSSTSGQLWTQGGVPNDPVLAQEFPGPEYAFGALRCATDKLNGDNVEFIFFPTGVKHVFCYAFYVRPSPTSGLITIRKAVTGAPPGERAYFPFNGSVSYDPNGFQLADGQSMDFYRAGGATWTVTEGSVDRYHLNRIDCTVQGTHGGAGTSTVVTSGSTATIHLVAGDHVDCTFENQYVPPAGGLTIRKVTTGGVGTFTYTVTPEAGGATQTATATTTQTRVPVDAVPSPLTLTAGRYTIAEHEPHVSGGTWRLYSISCNGTPQSAGHIITITVLSGETVVCSFRNVYTPHGSIAITKVSRGSIGAFSFQITSLGGHHPDHFLQQAITHAPDVPVAATPNSPADATNRLALGPYRIVEKTPVELLGDWTLVSVICDGVAEPFDLSGALVELTRHHPSTRCEFVNDFTLTPLPPLPPPPPPPPPEPPVSPDQPAYPPATLSVAKRASPSVVVQGGSTTYRIAVTNRGPDAAQSVTLTDILPAGGEIQSVQTQQGSCVTTPNLACILGTVGARATVHVTVSVRITHPPGYFTNRAVVGSASDDTTLVHNVARATVRVIAHHPPTAGFG